MKPIKINCPVCKNIIEIRLNTQTVRCSGCGKIFEVRVEISLVETKNEKIN